MKESIIFATVFILSLLLSGTAISSQQNIDELIMGKWQVVGTKQPKEPTGAPEEKVNFTLRFTRKVRDNTYVGNSWQLIGYEFKIEGGNLYYRTYAYKHYDSYSGEAWFENLWIKLEKVGDNQYREDSNTDDGIKKTTWTKIAEKKNNGRVALKSKPQEPQKGIKIPNNADIDSIVGGVWKLKGMCIEKLPKLVPLHWCNEELELTQKYGADIKHMYLTRKKGDFVEYEFKISDGELFYKRTRFNPEWIKLVKLDENLFLEKYENKFGTRERTWTRTRVVKPYLKQAKKAIEIPKDADDMDMLVMGTWVEETTHPDQYKRKFTFIEKLKTNTYITDTSDDLAYEFKIKNGHLFYRTYNYNRQKNAPDYVKWVSLKKIKDDFYTIDTNTSYRGTLERISIPASLKKKSTTIAKQAPKKNTRAVAAQNTHQVVKAPTRQVQYPNPPQYKPKNINSFLLPNGKVDVKGLLENSYWEVSGFIEDEYTLIKIERGYRSFSQFRAPNQFFYKLKDLEVIKEVRSNSGKNLKYRKFSTIEKPRDNWNELTYVNDDTLMQDFVTKDSIRYYLLWKRIDKHQRKKKIETEIEKQPSNGNNITDQIVAAITNALQQQNNRKPSFPQPNQPTAVSQQHLQAAINEYQTGMDRCVANGYQSQECSKEAEKMINFYRKQGIDIAPYVDSPMVVFDRARNEQFRRSRAKQQAREAEKRQREQAELQGNYEELRRKQAELTEQQNRQAETYERKQRQEQSQARNDNTYRSPNRDCTVDHWDKQKKSNAGADEYWVYVQNSCDYTVQCIVTLKYDQYGPLRASGDSYTNNGTIVISPGQTEGYGIKGTLTPGKRVGYSVIGRAYSVKCHKLHQ